MVQKQIKSRGRPRKFDDATALEQAMMVFWAKGYDGTTVDDLVAAMGVGRPSLYATFGDKETLFLRCLNHYIHKFGAVTVETLGATTIREGIRGFLRQGVLGTTAKSRPRGCMMGNVASVVVDARIRKFTVRAMAQPAEIVERRFRAAVDEGELPRSFPCALRARQVIDLSMGLALRARLGVSRKELLKDADASAALFL